MRTPLSILIPCLFYIALLLPGCAKKPEEQKQAGPRAVIITTTKAEVRDVPVVERSVGEADSSTAPKVASEVSGRVIKVLVEIGDPVKSGQVLAEIDSTDFSADAKRLEAQAMTQQKLTERYVGLNNKGFISSSRLEEVEAQNVSAREQFARASKNLSRTSIRSPVSGRVDNRFVSVGDWIDMGKPVFQLSTSENLRIRLPFPETAASRMMVGQAVNLTTPAAPGQVVTGKIKQLRPIVGNTNRSFDAIVEIKNPGNWRPGASVNGAVTIETHQGAVTVPEQSVVLRPAGAVVYVVEAGHAAQRIVKIGGKQGGYIEILEGMRAGEDVVVDGAGFLTDKAAVVVKGDMKKGDKK